MVRGEASWLTEWRLGRDSDVPVNASLCTCFDNELIFLSNYNIHNIIQCTFFLLMKSGKGEGEARKDKKTGLIQRLSKNT